MSYMAIKLIHKVVKKSYIKDKIFASTEILELTFETAHALFPGSLYVTVLEEGLLLSPDFLAYSATVLPLLHDPTILAISAWNANGKLFTNLYENENG